MTSRNAPVTDWAHDFDHMDPAWTSDPYPIWEGLRRSCPVAHSERYGGAWLPVRHEDISAVAYDTEHFSSRAVLVSDFRPGAVDVAAPVGPAPPITSDPPFHTFARRMLLTAFSPTRIAELEPFIRQLCGELLDGTRGRAEIDAAVDYAQHVPVRVIIGMLGFPQKDADTLRHFIHHVMEDVDSPEERQAFFAGGELDAYMEDRIAEHRARPRQDLTSFLLGAELCGRKLTPEHVRGTMVLLMIAGIDTTWSAIGASLWHLASHPEDRRRLTADPGLMDTTVEELFHAYAPVTMARLVIKDVELGGCRLHEGEWVLLPFPAADRDPGGLPRRADRVRLDRTRNRHASFGLGVHRCLGSHLARMELRVALEEWIARYPEFELADPAAVTWSGGQVRGPRTLQVRLPRAS